MSGCTVKPKKKGKVKVARMHTREHPAPLLQTNAGTIHPQACLGWWFDKLALSSRRCALCQWVCVCSWICEGMLVCMCVCVRLPGYIV